MKVVLVVGTRPEIIKMSPIVLELRRRGVDYQLVHTGQHYDFLMSRIFFEDLGLPHEMVNLGVGSGTHAETTTNIMVGLEKLLRELRPDVVLVQGDTDTVLAGALTSNKLHIKLGHVEAGLRSFDRRLPEEYNRIICDHIADYLFTPTKSAANNLRREGIGKKRILYVDGVRKQRIMVVGNTIVDAVKNNLERAKKGRVLDRLKIRRQGYFLVTAHREENVDFAERLQKVIEGIGKVSKEFGWPVIFPLHPRTDKKLVEFRLKKQLERVPEIRLIDPVGFGEMLELEVGAKAILTDSGGVQEEAATIGVPCVVLRERMDRPEAMVNGITCLVGIDPEKIYRGLRRVLLAKNRRGRVRVLRPYGDGKTAKRIVDFLLMHGS